MLFKYSTTNATQNEFDSLPRIPLILKRDNQQVEAIGLVDSGATVNVISYQLGLDLGGIWDARQAIIQLGGNLGNQSAMAFSAIAHVGEYPPIELVFAWVQNPNIPLILGQTNFFMEFDVFFYRSRLEFEIKPKS
ncbi:MAG: hypothetical protein AB4058_15675 [Microcystaceae cyanobacterium]